MNKDNDKEAIRSEEERVASFMQALQRMHDDPAEVARIELMIEEAEAGLADEVGEDQPLVVHIHNEGHLDFTAPRHVVEPPPVAAASDDRSEPYAEPTTNRGLRSSATAAFPLALMSFVVIHSMQEGRASQWLTAVLSAVFMLTAAALTLIRAVTDREMQSRQRGIWRVRGKTRARELNRQ
ncbi:hypothetical protein ACIQPR_09745 [Streptomyces sp. NPDC091280]|uniref:hypothetical protein n=1 Tax=Streptomyces sp. NPDC091280 TaxID=3365984 RepID=UPI00381ED88D